MTDTRKEKIVSDLKKQNDSYADLELLILVDEKSIETYDILVFHITMKTIEDLAKIWEDLANDIALRIQLDLTKAIELWNVYIFYFVEQKIENDKAKTIKFQIENDTYSARKIIIDNCINPEKEIMVRSLFTGLSLDKKNIDKTERNDDFDISIKTLIDEMDSKNVDISSLENFLNKLV